MKLKLLVGVGIPAFLWVALFLSGFGILVETDVRRDRYKSEKIYCSYFTGTEKVTKYLGRFPMSEITSISCPRWHRLGG